MYKSDEVGEKYGQLNDDCMKGAKLSRKKRHSAGKMQLEASLGIIDVLEWSGILSQADRRIYVLCCMRFWGRHNALVCE